eukprot:scaffold319_cov244-Pinguiococcus_pyrenoidosus.AAC.5
MVRVRHVSADAEGLTNHAGQQIRRQSLVAAVEAVHNPLDRIRKNRTLCPRDRRRADLLVVEERDGADIGLLGQRVQRIDQSPQRLIGRAEIVEAAGEDELVGCTADHGWLGVAQLQLEVEDVLLGLAPEVLHENVQKQRTMLCI